MNDAEEPSVCVFAPDPLLTVTIEVGPDGGDEIHLHPGGQGFWVSRMCSSLGLRTVLVGPFGGETGTVVRHLMAKSDPDMVAVDVAGSNGGYVHDRRDGERVARATMPPTALSRHDLDDLYGAALTAGLGCTVTVLAGPGPWDPPILDADVYRRLAVDLTSAGRTVIADLSGGPRHCAVQGGLSLLKLSHEELEDDGLVDDGGDVDAIVEAMHKLRKEGVRDVVVSRAEAGPIALLGDEVVEVSGPRLEAVDHRGAGDSMTGALAAGLAQGMDGPTALRLATAAGALNVTRRGLAAGDRERILELAEHFELRTVTKED
jgi:1-phosphofructokinase